MSGEVARQHNDAAGKIAAEIITGPLQAGGTSASVLVLLESVVVGVALAVIRLGGDEQVLDVVFRGAKRRLAELRLKDIETKGRG